MVNFISDQTQEALDRKKPTWLDVRLLPMTYIEHLVGYKMICYL